MVGRTLDWKGELGRWLKPFLDRTQGADDVPFLEKWGGSLGSPAKMAATNKCLAKNNKSPDRRGATKEAKPPMKGYRSQRKRDPQPQSTKRK
jgi:hypothetical protein